MRNPLSRRHLIAATATAGAVSFSGLAAQAQAQPRTRIAVRIDRDAEVLDPGFRTGSQEGSVVRCVMQRLMHQKPNSAELENDAAAEMRQTSPTIVEFRLKPGQMFTDGFGEMTAEDVKFSFERIGIPQQGQRESPYRADWASLERVEVTGQYTGRIVLSRPRASLFNIAIGDVSGCIMSKRAVEARGTEHAQRPVGSGPYQVASFERQRQVLLRRNPGYGGPAPRFEEIAVRPIQDPRTTELALRSGEIDFASLPPTIAEPLRTVQGLNVDAQPGLSHIWLGMNVEKPPFNDIRVRQAIRHAIDVDQMLLAGYNGRAPRANALVMPQVLGHWREAPAYRRNVTEARRLIAEAGHANGFRTRITVLNQPVFQTMALVARAMLQEIGITVEVDAKDGGSFWSSGQGDTGRNLEMFILRFGGKLDPNFLSQWFVSGQVGTWNWQRWANPEFDQLMDRAAGELDQEARTALVVRAQQIMDQSAAFVWLTYDVNYIVTRSWLRPAFLPGAADWQFNFFERA